MCKPYFQIFDEIFTKSPHANNLKKVIKNRCVGDYSNWYNPQNPCSVHRLEILDFMMTVLIRKNCA